MPGCAGCTAPSDCAAAPVSVQADLPKTKIHKPVAPAAKGCKSASDCSCPQGSAKMCLNGQCGCGDPIVIESDKATTTP